MLSWRFLSSGAFSSVLSIDLVGSRYSCTLSGISTHFVQQVFHCMWASFCSLLTHRGYRLSWSISYWCCVTSCSSIPSLQPAIPIFHLVYFRAWTIFMVNVLIVCVCGGLSFQHAFGQVIHVYASLILSFSVRSTFFRAFTSNAVVRYQAS